jgi:hypothetical protein
MGWVYQIIKKEKEKVKKEKRRLTSASLLWNTCRSRVIDEFLFFEVRTGMRHGSRFMDKEEEKVSTS